VLRDEDVFADLTHNAAGEADSITSLAI